MRFPRRAIIASTIAAACLAAAGTVALATHPTSAEASDGDAARMGTSVISPKLAQARAREERGVPQIVSGRFGVAATAAPAAAGTDAGATDDVVTYAYAGDSITARNDSWLHVLASDRELEAVGGYAHSGYRSDQVLRDVSPVPGADVLVLELGTNDINQGVADATVIRNLDAVAKKVGAARVLLVATPPDDHDWSLWGVNRRLGSVQLNKLLVTDAARHGWVYADPFSAYREADNSYKPGSTVDGIHPTAAANEVIARQFARDIREAARSDVS